MTDIHYIVKINKNKIDSIELCYMFYKTTFSNIFYGRLVNQNSRNFYFKLNNSNALVIIPHSWIEWMAPSKIIWEKKDG